MALTQVKAEGIATGAVTTTKLDDDAVSNAKLTSSTNQANRAVGADTVQDDAIGVAALSATGTASNTTFLRGDNSWVTPTDTNTTYSVQDGQLSQNNFTDADHTKLDGIAAGAEVNVQSDWNSSSGDNQILNKPTIPAAVGGATGVDFNDTVKARWGSDNDLEVVHSGSHATIKNITGNLNITNTGSNTIINSDNITFQSGDQGETIARFLDEGACELWFNNSKKFNTTADGVSVSGDLRISTDNDYIGLGTDNDLQIRHTGSAALIGNSTGNLNIQTSGNIWVTNQDDSEVYFKAVANDAVYLYYDNNQCLETRPDGGVEVTDGNFIVGTTGHGIQFDTGDSGSDQLLNDYEEGTWIPTLNSNLSYNSSSYNTFSYTKIGRSVTIRGLFYPGSWSGTDTVTLSLPFASANLTQISNAGGQGCMFRNIDGDYGTLAAYVDDNGTVLKFYRCQGNNTNWSSLNNSHLNQGTEIYVSVTYFSV